MIARRSYVDTESETIRIRNDSVLFYRHVVLGKSVVRIYFDVMLVNVKEPIQSVLIVEHFVQLLDGAYFVNAHDDSV